MQLGGAVLPLRALPAVGFSLAKSRVLLVHTGARNRFRCASYAANGAAAVLHPHAHPQLAYGMVCMLVHRPLGTTRIIPHSNVVLKIIWQKLPGILRVA